MRRRHFIRNTILATAGLSMLEKATLATATAVNKLPKWKGFNLLDFYSPDPAPTTRPTVEEHFKWMQDWGFDFIRIPIAYPHYLQFDRSKNISPEEVYNIDKQKVEEIEASSPVHEPARGWPTLARLMLRLVVVRGLVRDELER